MDTNIINNNTLLKQIHSRIIKAIDENNEKEVIKCLEDGADINFMDSDNNNNTPLHVAAITGNLKIFELLLKRGANYNIANNDNQTIIDIIDHEDTPNKKELSNAFYMTYGGTKRTGTGSKGQLYETKLLSLILVRALHNTTHFILGTNVEDMGAFDDIVIRYKTGNMEQSKILILQIKHRENERWSAEYILKLIYEYYESYLQIKEKLLTDNDNIMFEDSNEDIQCEFIIYTSAQEYVTRKKNKNMKNSILVEATNIEEQDSLIKTSENGRIFKFQYEREYLRDFVSVFTESRIKAFARALTNSILKDQLENIMTDNFLRMYHVYIAQNIIEKCSCKNNTTFLRNLLIRAFYSIAMQFFPTTLMVASVYALFKIIKRSSEHSENCLGRFRSSFLTSNDKNHVLIKREIFKEVAKNKRMPTDYPKHEMESILREITFKIPKDFSNSQVHVNNETKLQKRLKHLYTILQKLFESEHYRDSKYVYIEIGNNSIGKNKLFQRKDFKLCWLGGLIGNLFIHDVDTDMLKINMNIDTLTNENKKIFCHLKEKYDLSIYRFDINVQSLPKLTLTNRKQDEKLVEDFLTRLKVYTNQSQEDEVELILKDEISRLLYKKQRKQIDHHIRDTIFLKIHDRVQKWSLRAKLPYLTKFHNFYQEAVRETYDSSSRLKTIHTENIKIIRNTLINFETAAILTLRLDSFLNNFHRFMVIISNEIFFTSIKIYQYFTEILMQHNFIYINLDSENFNSHLEILQDELELSVMPICVIISITSRNVSTVQEMIRQFDDKVTKIILVTYNYCELNQNKDNNIIYQTDFNNFSSLSESTRNTIFTTRYVIFQGNEFMVSIVLDKKSLNLLSCNLLLRLINGEKIRIGKELSFADVDYYIPRNMYRCVKLNTNSKYNINSDIYYIKEDAGTIDVNDFVPHEINDIILITNDENFFRNTCNKYSQSNVHWFSNTFSNVIYNTPVWKQSQGSTQSILKYINKISESVEKEFNFCPDTLEDLQEKVVIINAKAGMGKSTLLSQLAIKTQFYYPNLWIVKINLLDESVLNKLHYWLEHKVKINLEEAIKFLHTEVLEQNSCDVSEILNLLSVEDNNEIHLNITNNQPNTTDVDLSDINLFNYFYNNGKLAILFDGFDEICPTYTTEVIQLLCILKSSKVAHLWITSRPYDELEKLESALGTFSYHLSPFNAQDQKDYLTIIWHRRLGLPHGEESRIPIGKIEYFHSVVSRKLCMNPDFLGQPLHLFMFAHIYQNDVKQFIELKKEPNFSNIEISTNITHFYETFTKKKFAIQFGEKNSSMNSKDPTVRNLIEEKRKELFNNHKKLSAYYYLNKHVPLSEYDIKSVEEFINKINSGVERTAILEWRPNNKPNFIHINFAEYFALEFIFDQLKSDNCTTTIWKYFTDEILTRSTITMRTFVNSKLQTDKSTLIAKLKDNVEHFSTVLDVLLSQFNDVHIFSAIYLSILEDLEYVAMFLIECLKIGLVIFIDKLSLFKKLINQTCGQFCIFCAARIRSTRILNYLNNLITTIENLHTSTEFNQVLGNNLPTNQGCVTLNSLSEDEHINNLLGQFLSESLNYTKVESTRWLLGRCGYLISFCLDHVIKFKEEERLKFFDIADFKQSHSIKYISKNLNKDFYIAITALFSTEVLNKMWSTDSYDFKYISLMLCNVFLEICDIPKHNSNTSIEDFIIHELPNLFTKHFNMCIKNQLCRIRTPIIYGQDMYTTKLYYNLRMFNIILLRALCTDNIKDFTLTRLTGTGFDDIAIRYVHTDTQETKIILIKMIYLHENLSKGKSTVIFDKGFQSFLLLKQKFATANKQEIFYRGSLKNIDHKIIICDTVKGEPTKQQVVKSIDEENILTLNKNEMLYKLIYDEEDVDLLVSTIIRLQTVALAKILLMYITYTPRTIVADEFITTYHLFLSQKVIEVKYILVDHCICKYRHEFLRSTEISLQYFKSVICAIISSQKGITIDEAEIFIQTYSFELPVEFCQDYFGYYYQYDMDWQDVMPNLVDTFEKIFQNSPCTSSECIIELDDDSVGPDEIIKRNDLVGNNSLAGLVGSLLIYDDTTRMLKFNLNESSLSKDKILLLRRLEETYDLKKYRFDINIYGFPKLALYSTRYVQKLAREFLSKIRFYYINIDKIDKLLKSDLNKYFVAQRKPYDARFRVKCDAILLTHLKCQNKHPDRMFSTIDLESYEVPVTNQT